MINVNLLKSQYPRGFANYLTDASLVIFEDIFNKQDVKKLDTEINNFYADRFTKYFLSEIICKIALVNLVIDETPTMYKIHMNYQINYPGAIINLMQLCRLINYGNLTVKGCHIFTQINSILNSRLNYYFSLYKRLK